MRFFKSSKQETKNVFFYNKTKQINIIVNMKFFIKFLILNAKSYNSRLAKTFLFVVIKNNFFFI